MPEAAPHASLTVLGGPLDGQQLVLDQTIDEVLIGSDADCSLCIDLPSVSPIHARIWMDQDGASVHNTHSAQGTYVNDDLVVDKTPLRDGDILWLGAPGGDGSVMLQWRAAAVVELQPVAQVTAETHGDDDAFGAFAEPMSASEPEPEPPASPDPDLTDFGGGASTGPEPAPPADAGAQADAGGFDDDAFFVSPSAEPPPEPPPAPPAAFVFDEPVPDAGPSAAFAEPEPAAAPPEPVPEPVPESVPEPPMAFAEAPSYVAPVAAAPAVFDAEAENPFAAPAEDVPAFQMVDVPAAAPAPVAPPPPPPPAAPVASPSRATPTPRERPARPPSGTHPRPAAAVAGRAAASNASPWASSSPETAAAPPAAAAPPPPARRGALAAGGGNTVRNAALGAGAILAVGAIAFFALRGSPAPELRGVSPARVARGATLTLSGQHFATDPAANDVTIGASHVRVASASDSALTVEVPDLPAAAAVPVVVTVKGKASAPASVAVYQVPRVLSLEPSAALPGDEVVVNGTGFAVGVKVKFGGMDAIPVEGNPTALRVKVPALDAVPGTAVPVTVSAGSDVSAPVTFLVGHVPIVTGGTPASVKPGDILTLAGRGFAADPRANDVRFGNVRALVVSAEDAKLEVFVPRLAPSPAAVVHVKVPGSESVGETKVAVVAPDDPVGFRFIAEPFEDAPGHDHAVLYTGLGPAFVLTGSSARTAGKRAQEAVQRLDAIAATLAASPQVDFEARGIDGADPVVGVRGVNDILLRVSAEDAQGYNEGWTGKGKADPATPARLALWWNAVARDLAVMLVRGDRPRYTAELATEGRVLGDVYEAARRARATGIPTSVVADMKGPAREALRVVGFRLPDNVIVPTLMAMGGPAAEASAAPAGIPPLSLVGAWSGREVLDGVPTEVSVNFVKGGGTVTYQRAVALTMQLQSVQVQKNTVRMQLEIGGKLRHYMGRWDGERISGTIATDPAGRTEVGTFELTPSR